MKFIYFLLALPFNSNSNEKNNPKIKTQIYGDHNDLTNIEPELFGDYRKLYKTGYCEPYMNHTDDSDEKMQKIKLHFYKFSLLKQLQSNISIYDKLTIINDHELSQKYNLTPSIISGGLLDDWEFEL